LFESAPNEIFRLRHTIWPISAGIVAQQIIAALSEKLQRGEYQMRRARVLRSSPRAEKTVHFFFEGGDVDFSLKHNYLKWKIGILSIERKG